jgi:large subunit ribosomal protein L31
MKADIHPTYHTDAKITCACGNVIDAGSTAEAISVELCSACHPFYTGKQKILDSARRVEKFQAKMENKSEDVLTHADKKAKKAERAAKRKAEREAKEKAEATS